jgi:hypothetical protein
MKKIVFSAILLIISTIAAKANLVVTANSKTVCNYECTTLTATATGGSEPYTYAWLPLASSGQSKQVCPVVTTTYTVTVTDNSGVTASSIAVVTDIYSDLQISFVSKQDPTCGEANGSLMTSGGGQGGAPPYGYKWMYHLPGEKISLNIEQQTQLIEGIYAVVVTDSKGCTASATAELVNRNYRSISNNNDTVFCSGVKAGAISKGNTSKSPNTTLYVSKNSESDSTLLDIDCDGKVDMLVRLRKGSNSTPYSTNDAELYIKNPSFELSIPSFFNIPQLNYIIVIQPKYYNWGDALPLSESNQWSEQAGKGNIEKFSLGSSTSFLGKLPSTLNNKYIAYRKYNIAGVHQIGWIKISFDLEASTTILSISEYLSLCETTAIDESVTSNTLVKAFPNPFTDQVTFTIQSEKLNETYSFQLTDALGKEVKTVKEITTNEFEISRNGLEKGIYFYKIYSAENTIGIGKIIIN